MAEFGRLRNKNFLGIYGFSHLIYLELYLRASAQ